MQRPPDHPKFPLYMGLLAGFDFLACIALMMLSDDNKFGAGSQSQGLYSLFWQEQVVHFTFKSSVFDVVCLALLRFGVLALYYTWKKGRKASVVAMVTTISLAYAVIKVVLFLSDAPLAPALLFAAFLLPCLETWLYISKGKRAKAPPLSEVTVVNNVVTPGETRPLLENSTSVMLRSPSSSPPISPVNVPEFEHDDEHYSTPPERAEEMQHRQRQHVDTQHTLMPVPMSPDEVEWRRKLQSAITEVKHMAQTEEGWRFVVEKRGVRVFERPEPRCGGNMMKGVVRVKHPPRVCGHFIHLINERKGWNPGVKSCRVIASLDNVHTRIGQTEPNMPFPTSAREFLYIEGYQNNDDGSMTSAAISVDHPLMPEIPGGIIRAQLICSGFHSAWVSSNPADGSYVTYIYALDLKGWIPTSVVSRANLEQPLNLADMTTCLDRYVSKHGTAFAD